MILKNLMLKKLILKNMWLKDCFVFSNYSLVKKLQKRYFIIDLSRAIYIQPLLPLTKKEIIRIS